MDRCLVLVVTVVLSLSLLAVPTPAQHAGDTSQRAGVGLPGPVSDQQSVTATAGDITISLDQRGKPGERVIDSTVSFGVVLESPTNGVGAYEIPLELNESSTANATFVDGKNDRSAFGTVNISENGSRIEFVAALGNGKYDPADQITVAEVTVAVETPGTLVIDPLLSDGVVSDINNSEYNRSAEPGTTTVIESLDPFPGQDTPPGDLTGDGYLEDIRGDGGVGIGDILTLFNNRNSVDRPEFFNFRGGDPSEVGIDDILTLFNKRRT